MTTGHSNEDVKDSVPAREDRLWILVNARNRESYLEQLFCGGPRPTLIVRDREQILISVDVGRGSALAGPFRIDELTGSGATLIVRLVSATAPCAGCVDESLAAAVEAAGWLGAPAIFRAVRAGIARCAARSLSEPAHAAPGGAERPLESSGARVARALRLVPPNAPRVPAGGAPAFESDIDVVLII